MQPSVASVPARSDVLNAPPEAPAPVEPDRGNLTPMMKQYLETKAQVGDALLFFRLGDFYELFFEDAHKASELLKITLYRQGLQGSEMKLASIQFQLP